MLIEIKDQELFIKALIYGSFGSGKTHLACSSSLHSDMAPVLLIDIEGGPISSIDKTIKKTPVIKTIEEIEAIFWKLSSKEGEYAKFKTVIIDSGTALQDLILMNLMKNSRNKNGIDQSLYNLCRLQMMSVISKFVHLDINFIMTAAERVDYPIDNNGNEDRSNGPSHIGPGFTPSLSKSMSHMFSFVWRMSQIDSKTRDMQTTKDHPVRAKTRVPEFAQKLGSIVRNPYMPDIYNLLKSIERK